MSKQVAKNRIRSGSSVIVRPKGGFQVGGSVKFGTVVIRGAKPSAEVVVRNVELSTSALERVFKRLAKPGVTIRQKKDVPQYAVAEGELSVFIRRLNGRTERGRLVKGEFRVIND